MTECLNIHAINTRNVLVTDFVERKKATASFLSLFTDTSICNTVKQFQLHINNVILDINNVCACCGLFIPFEINTLLTKVHLEFVSAIKAAIIVNDDLDYYKRTDNSSYFYNTCYGMIVEKQIPKFGSTNCINVLPYQKYPDVLSNLTFVKKAFIACAHPIISVIKLKPSGTSLTTSYHQIQGHVVVLP